MPKKLKINFPPRSIVYLTTTNIMNNIERSQRQAEILQKQADLMREYEQLQSYNSPQRSNTNLPLRQYMTPEETELLIQQQTMLTQQQFFQNQYVAQMGMLQPQNTYVLQQPSIISAQVIEISEDLPQKKRLRYNDAQKPTGERPQKKANARRTLNGVTKVAPVRTMPDDNDHFLARFNVDPYAANQGKVRTNEQIKKMLQEKNIPFSVGEDQSVIVSIHGRSHRIYITENGSIHLLELSGSVVSSFACSGTLLDYIECNVSARK